jgi:FkbM family methyltransferase
VTAIPSGAGARHATAILTGYSDRSANRGVSRIEGAAVTRSAIPADETEPRFQIECVSVDSLVTHLALVDVVKIDVDGAELDVLHGMTQGLAAARYRALVLELHPSLLRERGISPDDCLRPLLDCGYRGWMIDQSRRTYGRAIDPRVPSSELLLPLEQWQNDPWPHLFWLAPGEPLI